MSYLNQAQDPHRRVVALAGVAVIHAMLAGGIVVGLTVNGVTPPDAIWDPFEITPDPQPKPPPPEPRKEQKQDSFVTVPPTPLDPIPRDPVKVEVRDFVDDTRVVVDPGPPLDPVPDPPQPTFAPRRAMPTNVASRWITTDDYPSRPLRDGVEGTGAYRLTVGANGRVAGCDVTRSTGDGQLDAATCRFITQRARFEAATDATGAKVVGHYTGTVKWEIPD